MEQNATVFVLGAYGLAGRAIVARLLEKTPFYVIAAGRDRSRLKSLYGDTKSERVQIRVLDARDGDALRGACKGVSFVINAVGPFARFGAAIARTVLESGVAYLDCANEQRHYRQLEPLNSLALEKGVPLITAAGAIPGCSTLLIASLLERFPDAANVECCWAQFRHAYADAGLASMMGGILEALENPIAIRRGQNVPVVLGKSVKDIDLPPPFGMRRMMEVPTIDTLSLPRQYTLAEYHTWFYMGDLPMWLLDVIRVLQPQRRAWAYRLIETIMGYINKRDTNKAIASGAGPESLLVVTASNKDRSETKRLLFRDGAIATACLPVYITEKYLQGKITKRGLMTPQDIVVSAELPGLLEGALLDSYDDRDSIQ